MLYLQKGVSCGLVHCATDDFLHLGFEKKEY